MNDARQACERRMAGLLECERAAHDDGFFPISADADATADSFTSKSGRRCDGRIRRTNRAQNMRIGAGSNDQIALFKRLRRPAIEDNLAAALHHDVDATQSRLTE